MSTILLLILVGVLALHSPLQGQDTSGGALDLGFGVNGVASISAPSGFVWTNGTPAMHRDSNGLIYTAAIARRSLDGSHLIVTRINASGGLDTSFGTNGYATALLSSDPGLIQDVRSIVRLSPSGRIVVGISQPTQARLTAFTSTGSLDTVFGSGGSASFAGAKLNGICPDGTGLSAFGSIAVSGAGKDAWERPLTEFGQVRGTSFLSGINGLGDQEITCEGILEDGNIVAVGHSTLTSGARSVFIAQRYISRSSSIVPLVIGTTGTVQISVPNNRPLFPKSFNIDPLGEYTIVCESGVPGSTDVNAVAIRLQRNGTIDPEFNGGTLLSLPFFPNQTTAETVSAAVSYLGNRQLVLQTVRPSGGLTSIGLTRYSWNGNLDSSFGTSGRAYASLASSAQAHGLLLAGNTRIIVLSSTQPSVETSNLFLMAFHSGPQPENNAVVITEQPQDVHVENGISAFLTLAAHSSATQSPIRYQLKKNGVRFGPSSMLPSFSFSSNPSLEGNYSVEVSNGFVSTESQTVAVYISQPPRWDQPGKLNEAVIVGSPLIVSPRFNGRFPMAFTWRRVGGPLLRNEPISFLNWTWSNAPSFNPAKISDTGIYELQISNADGLSPVLTVDLKVVKDPGIATQSESTLISVGEDTYISATAIASTPTITYSITKNGRPIPWSEESQGIDFRSVSLSDAGTYVIKARTIKGTASTRPIEIAVVDTSPVWRVSKPGGNVSFEVPTSGRGISYAWFKDDVALAESAKHRGTKKRILVLNGAEASDIGDYVCEVTAHGTTKRTGAQALHLVNEKATLTTSFLPPAQVGTIYNATVATTPLTSRISVTGLPRGLTLNPLNGKISGIARVPGDYKPTFTSINPWGRTSQAIPLRVNALPSTLEGRFVGMGSDWSGQPSFLGLTSLIISRTGSLSGSMIFSKLNGTRQTIPIRATLTNSIPDSGDWVSYNLRFKPPISTGFTLGVLTVHASEKSKGVGIDLQLVSPAVETLQDSVYCSHVPWHPTQRPVSSLVGQYNLGSFFWGDEEIRPSGHNFTHVTVRSNGSVTQTGVLSDNSPIVSSTWLTHSQTVPVYNLLYGNRGVHKTTLAFSQGTQQDFRDNRVSGKMLWLKQPSLTRKESSYLNGFNISPDWSGSMYLPPNKLGTGPFMMNALPGENNLFAYFERSTEPRETLVTLTQKHQARSIDPGSSYLDRVTDLRFTPQTGLFTGTWIKNDWVETQTVPRLNSLRLPIKGLVVRLPESLGSKGVGFVRVPVKKTELDSFGRQKIRNLLESVSVTLSPK